MRVKRVPQSDLKQLIALQDELLGLYIKADGALAELLVDESVIELIKQYVGLLPIEGQKVEGEQKYLNYDDISENWEQLTRLVFNGSLDEKTRNIEGVTPSLVSNLHFLPYETQRELHLHKRRVEKTEELLKQREELEKLEKTQPSDS
ncbi:hypothetical protein Pam2_27 [Pseudanabaena phage Pam2]|nr:hypothetical protein Pam2_27 [Pseudanabaena phage Pam2]